MPLQIVDTFEESDEIMKNSQKPVVRLQAGLDAHQNEHLDDYAMRQLVRNIHVFHDMAKNCEEDFLFLQVTGASLCYWTFYCDGKWTHLNNYMGRHANVQIAAPEDVIRQMVEKLGDGERTAQEIKFCELFEKAYTTKE